MLIRRLMTLSQTDRFQPCFSVYLGRAAIEFVEQSSSRREAGAVLVRWHVHGVLLGDAPGRHRLLPDAGERRQRRRFHLKERTHLHSSSIRTCLRAGTSQKKRLIHFQVFFRIFYLVTVKQQIKYRSNRSDFFQMPYTDRPQAFEQIGVASM